jgi:NAD(P)-dependent dehydrogenase (short-subunit alcohol dehydrogenase family)
MRSRRGRYGPRSTRPIALPRRVSKFGSETPMKRPAQAEEIAPAFVFLAAPSCSSYITGEILPIIGGYLGG